MPTQQQLTDLFAGKSVRITHTNSIMNDVNGVCKAVHIAKGEENCFNIELENGCRFRFNPEVVTPNSVDGELRAFARGRRKIEVV